jgi:DNA-binding MarR family transcriptional regulator
MVYKQNDLRWLFHSLDHMHHNCVKAEFEKRGLCKASHPYILFVIRYLMKGELVSQKELADAIGISPATVAISIKRMGKAGLICKKPDERDRRRNIIALTEKGKEITDGCSAAFNEINRDVFKGFTKDEQEQLKKFYLRMIKNLESRGARLPVRLKGAKQGW